MARNPVPLPKDAALVDQRRRMTRPWIDYYTDQSRQVSVSSQRVGVVDESGQSASIASTSLPVLSVTEGLYRAAVFIHVTQAATSSSSISATIAYTSDAVALSASTGALTGNTTTTHSGTVFAFHSDGSTPLTYSTTYASSGATAMEYRIIITIEKVTA